ncbi:hypothetical protein [Luedemannella helvata]|uniref:Secreted protein n=1 Tax=Luedemannella helvata TaxID=349315 RepID=A0ABP4WM97_9ACTN
MNTRKPAEAWRLRRRLSASAAALMLLVTGATVLGTAGPAFAAGCRTAPYSEDYIGLVDIFASHESWAWGDFGPYYATSQCADIQVQSIPSLGDAAHPLYACVIFVNYTSSCNYWTYVPAGEWRNIATNVKDGTKFLIRLNVDLGTYYSAGVRGDW